MRVYKILLLLLVIYGCERDDICAEDTPTTPLLIIKFKNDLTVSDIKRPNELQIRVTEIGTDNGPIEPIIFETNQDSIMIPLRTNITTTEFEFIIDSDTTDDMVLPNSDTVNFQYTPQQEYVSSACGFKVNYLGLTETLTNEENGENWIKRIERIEENITNETAAHILIFH